MSMSKPPFHTLTTGQDCMGNLLAVITNLHMENFKFFEIQHIITGCCCGQIRLTNISLGNETKNRQIYIK